MKKKLFIYSLVLFNAAIATAQDAGFSQIQQVPVLLNPSNTGKFNQNWRVSGLFRNTSYNASHTYTTGAVIAEKSVKVGAEKRDALGIGVSGLFDQSNSGALKSNYIGLSMAYIKSLNVEGTSRLSAGLQAVWVTRRLDVNKLVFEDQFVSGGFSSSVPSADAYRGGSLNYLDVNAGLSYHYTGTNYGFNAGAALFHINKPKEEFWGEDYRLASRITTDLGGYIGMGNNDKLHLSAVASFQEEAREYLLGGYFSKAVGASDKDLHVNIGGYYRVNNSVIPYIGISFPEWGGGLSYDVGTGSENKFNNSRKSLELSVQAYF